MLQHKFFYFISIWCSRQLCFILARPGYHLIYVLLDSDTKKSEIVSASVF
jgi:hypothetical protein